MCGQQQPLSPSAGSVSACPPACSPACQHLPACLPPSLHVTLLPAACLPAGCCPPACLHQPTCASSAGPLRASACVHTRATWSEQAVTRSPLGRKATAHRLLGWSRVCVSHRKGKGGGQLSKQASRNTPHTTSVHGQRQTAPRLPAPGHTPRQQAALTQRSYPSPCLPLHTPAAPLSPCHHSKTMPTPTTPKHNHPPAGRSRLRATAWWCCPHCRTPPGHQQWRHRCR
jgi:hypothetical protein